MRATESFSYIFGVIHETLDKALEGLDAQALVWRPDPQANTIGWLAWHLTRVEDTHVVQIAERAQVWADGWAERFGLPADYSSHGYGQTPDEVAQIQPPSTDVVMDYNRAVTEMVQAYLAGATDEDLDRVIDRRWDPPVTVGVRLNSVVDDALQHVGQAAYVRGMYERR